MDSNVNVKLSQGTSAQGGRSPCTHWKCHFPRRNPQTLLPYNFGCFRFRHDRGTAIHADVRT
jgi:hypothetical protein